MAANITMDSLGLVQNWSPEAEQIFGYTALEAVGQSLGELIVPPRVRPHHEAGLKRYVETREGGSFGRKMELKALRKGGEIVAIEMIVQPHEHDQQITFEAKVTLL